MQVLEADLLDEGFSAFVLYVSFSGGEERADGVHVNAALDEPDTGTPELVQTVVICSVHHSCNRRDLDVSVKPRTSQFTVLGYLPNNVRGWRVTQPVWIYSMSCLKTSGSNSSIIRVSC